MLAHMNKRLYGIPEVASENVRFYAKNIYKDFIQKIFWLKTRAGNCFVAKKARKPTITDKIFETMSRNQAKLDRTRKL